MKKITFFLIIILTLLNLPGCNQTHSKPIVLNNNLIPKSTDNTLSPTGSTVNKQIDLSYFKMINENTGWGISNDGVLRTTNGGETWFTVLSLDVENYPNGIKSVYYNSDYSWITVENNDSTEVYSTSDSGRSWSKTSINTRGILDIYFVSPLKGWLMADPAGPAGPMEKIKIFQTNDGGKNWTNQENNIPDDGLKSSLRFLNPGNGFVTGMSLAEVNPIFLYKTTDGGKTWVPQPLTISEPFNAQVKTSLPPRIFGPDKAIFPVVIANKAIIFYRLNKDLWESTTALSLGAMPGNYDIVYDFDDSDSGWVAFEGKVYRTKDGGKTWENVCSLENVKQLNFVSKTLGWALIVENTKNRLFRTLDGGYTWEPN